MAFLLHEAGWEDATGLVGGALQIQADGQKLTDDVESLLGEQIDHHGIVVPQKDLAVIQRFVVSGMLKGGNASSQLPSQGNQGALEVFSSLLDHLIFLRAGANTLILLAEPSCHSPLRIAKT